MQLAGRLLLFLIIMDTFLYFGLSAVSDPTAHDFGGTMGGIMSMSGSPNTGWMGSVVSTNTTAAMVPADTQSWGSFSAIMNSVLGFIGMLFSMATVPFTMLVYLNAPTFVQVLIGGTYMAMAAIAVGGLITGRF